MAQIINCWASRPCKRIECERCARMRQKHYADIAEACSEENAASFVVISPAAREAAKQFKQATNATGGIWSHEIARGLSHLNGLIFHAPERRIYEDDFRRMIDHKAEVKAERQIVIKRVPPLEVRNVAAYIAKTTQTPQKGIGRREQSIGVFGCARGGFKALAEVLRYDHQPAVTAAAMLNKDIAAAMTAPTISREQAKAEFMRALPLVNAAKIGLRLNEVQREAALAAGVAGDTYLTKAEIRAAFTAFFESQKKP